MTLQQLREEFWFHHPVLEEEARRRRTRSKGQNHQTTTCRCAFVDWVDTMYLMGNITNRQAERATL